MGKSFFLITSSVEIKKGKKTKIRPATSYIRPYTRNQIHDSGALLAMYMKLEAKCLSADANISRLY